MVLGPIQALVLCGPSGSGKSTLIQRLFKEFPEKFGFSVSHTTRNPRPGEINGVHYHFTLRDEMVIRIHNGDFIECAVFSDNIYGTSKKAFEEVVNNGKICVLDIDVQGVKQIKQTGIKALYIFIKPPSIESLINRLKGRGTETEESLLERVNAAKEEIAYGDAPNNFHLVIVNDVLDKAYDTLKNFVMKELEKHNKEGDSNQSGANSGGSV